MVKVIVAFGLNEDGQCGSDTTIKDLLWPSVVRFSLSTPIEIIQVSAGSRHSLVLSSSGEVYSWGWGLMGQLGHGDCDSALQPTKINSLSKIASISAGGMHSACVDSDNTCYCWGSNAYGQLGIGKVTMGATKLMNEPFVSLPTKVYIIKDDGKLNMMNDSVDDESCKELLKVSKISCGGMHTAAIGLDGSVYCWGKADSGQLGCSTWYLDFSPGLFTPNKVQGFQTDSKIIDVKCGGFFTLLLTEEGNVYSMGKDDWGCLGSGTDMTNFSIGMESPTIVSSLEKQNIKLMATGGWHSCFLTNNGTLYVCGKGEYGRIGLGNEASRLFPTKLNASYDGTDLTHQVAYVSAGGSHTILSTKDNRIFATGRVDHGRCGLGAMKVDRICIPQEITQNIYNGNGGFNVVQVKAGGSHSLVLLDYPDVNSDELELLMTKIDMYQQSLSLK